MIIVAYFLIFCLLLFTFLFAFSIIWAFVRNVPHVATFWEYKRLLYKQLPELLKDSQSICELGSWSGRMSRYMAWLGKRVTGYEIDPMSQLFAYVLNWVGSLIKRYPHKPNIYLQNFMDLNQDEIQRHDTYYLYLFPQLMAKVYVSLISKMKPGTRIIVNSFPVKEMTPIHAIQNKEGREVIWVYEV